MSIESPSSSSVWADRVAAIYHALFAERYGLEGYERVFAAGTLAIAVSVVVLSLSATPGVRRYAGRRARTTLPPSAHR